MMFEGFYFHNAYDNQYLSVAFSIYYTIFFSPFSNIINNAYSVIFRLTSIFPNIYSVIDTFKNT